MQYSTYLEKNFYYIEGEKMVFVIVSLSLSALVIIATWLYINHLENTQKYREEKEVKPQQDVFKKYNIKDIWDILSFEDGILRLKGNRYTIVNEVDSIDYNFMDDKEQDAVEDVLRNIVLGMSHPIQFFSTTEYVDTSKIIQDIINHNENEQSLKVKAYAQDTVEYLKKMMIDKNVYIRKSYINISYDGLQKKANKNLKRNYELMKSNFNTIDIPFERVQDGKEFDLIYNVLNRGGIAKPTNEIKHGAFELYVEGGKRDDKTIQ